MWSWGFWTAPFLLSSDHNPYHRLAKIVLSLLQLHLCLLTLSLRHWGMLISRHATCIRCCSDRIWRIRCSPFYESTHRFLSLYYYHCSIWKRTLLLFKLDHRNSQCRKKWQMSVSIFTTYLVLVLMRKRYSYFDDRLKLIHLLLIRKLSIFSFAFVHWMITVSL